MNRLRWLGISCCGIAVLHAGPLGVVSSTAVAADDGKYLVYFGTYTGGKSQGIYVSRFDATSGKCSTPELAAQIKSPSFVALHPTEKYLYAVSEISDFDNKPTGGVSAFAINAASGQLTLLNQQPSGGSGPCHLVVDPRGKCVLVANYGGGSVSALPVRADGRLGPAGTTIQHQGSSVNPARQKEPHAHSINVDAANRFAFAADLGLDKVLIYRLDAAAAKLTPHDPAFAAVAPGSGPRHFAFHPDGRRAYVINEMLCTLTAFAYDAEHGKLTETQTLSTLPPGETLKPAYSTAEVRVHPSGKFVYGSNRGHDTIAVFAVDAASGKLSWVENQSTQGKTPRNFNIDPTGKFLFAANQSSDTVVLFRIDPQSGKLTPTGESLSVGSPVCVRFLKL